MTGECAAHLPSGSKLGGLAFSRIASFMVVSGVKGKPPNLGHSLAWRQALLQTLELSWAVHGYGKKGKATKRNMTACQHG